MLTTMLTNMLTTILPPTLIALGAIALVAICVSKTTRTAPITQRDANVLWKLHKRSDGCTARTWEPVTKKNGQTTGFQCECGFTYEQKRSL